MPAAGDRVDSGVIPDIRSSDNHDRAAHPIALASIPRQRTGAVMLIGLALVAVAIICSCAGAQWAAADNVSCRLPHVYVFAFLIRSPTTLCSRYECPSHTEFGRAGSTFVSEYSRTWSPEISATCRTSRMGSDNR